MSTSSHAAPMPLPTPNPTDTSGAPSAKDLDAVPARAAQLLYGVVSSPALRATLALAGLTAEEIVEGRRRLDACLAEPSSATAFDKAAMERRHAAIAELNHWDEPGFARLGAALKQHAPGAHAYVFGGVVASEDAEQAVLAIATFLGRVAVLEAGSTRAADPGAIAVLEARGLTREVRQHLLALVAAAFGPGGNATPDARQARARVEQLRALASWYDEWSETARALLKKRDELTRLGLSQRKARSSRARRKAADPIPDTERAPVKAMSTSPATVGAP